MAGTWTEQTKVLPGAYINIRTNEPLALTPGERGTVVILQEMSVGEDGTLYKITASENGFPEGVTAADRMLADEVLKNARTALIYKLPEKHSADHVSTALEALKTVHFDVLCYPYDDTSEIANKSAVVAWIKVMRDEEGKKCQAVLANQSADSEAIINVTQGVILSGGARLTAAQATAWVAGATAGAGITTSNTGRIYEGAVDVSPRLTRTEMEEAVKAGKFVFKVDSTQNVSAVYDINSLTTVSDDKNAVFRKNRVIRTIDNIANDVASIFEANYVGKVTNNEDGRALLKSYLAEYFTALQNMSAIQEFKPDDIEITAGETLDAVVISVAVQPMDSVEKIYITVNLS